MNILLDLGTVLISIISGLCLILSFFITRTLKKVDKNQSELWEKYDIHENRLSRIEREHAVYTQARIHGKRQD